MPEGARVVFSAHGVSPAVRDAAEARQLTTIDATCPLVTKVHKEAVRFAREDRTILLIGHTGHEEVEGTAGEAPEHTIVVNSPEDVDGIESWLYQAQDVTIDTLTSVLVAQGVLTLDELCDGSTEKDCARLGIR